MRLIGVFVCALSVLAAGTAMGTCICLGCDHTPEAACRTCEQAASKKRSCCSEKRPEQEGPRKHDCTHKISNHLAPCLSSDIGLAAAVAAGPEVPALRSPADAPQRTRRAPERVRRKLYLLTAALLL